MTVSELFPESDERTRAQIKEALGDTLFVEAGAGTGKTRALVDQMVSLVLSGIPIERLAAITFTERAAAELRERVRSALERELRERAADAKITSALESLDRARISTIHSFARALLASYAAEAGIDPDFAVQDPVTSSRRLQERWRIYLEPLGKDMTAREAVDRVLGLGLNTREIEGLALDLAGRGDLAQILASAPLSAPPPQWPDLHQLCARLESAGIDRGAPRDRLRTRGEAALTLVKALCTADGSREGVLASGAGTLRADQKGNAGNWPGTRDEVLSVISDVQAVLDKVLAECRAEALSHLMSYIVRFVQQDAVLRNREGALTFDDLILRVRDLLRDDPPAVRSFRVRYDVLLIDEFQDTDPLQVDIALAFAIDPDTGRLQPGRLFLVGDPKQSIYRFRRADMEVYARTRWKVQEAGGRFPQLALNRRSRKGILDWVNNVFATVIGEGEDPSVQPPYRAIHPERTTGLNGPGVAVMGEIMELKAREVRWREAEAVTALCLAARDERWQVQQRDGALRDARLGDIAILIPRRIMLAPLERSLSEAGAPYRVEGGSLVYRTQEVRDMINCLTAIDDPSDEVAIVGALRSPAFTCSDVDLAVFRAGGGRFDYLRDGLEARDGPVAEGLRALRRYHLERHETSLAVLVERFVAESGQVEVGIIDQGDRNAFRRARFLVEQARRFEVGGPQSLRSLVQWLEQQAGGMVVDHEGAGVDDDEDAVRVLTIHGAKGLEFPIVLLCGLGAAAPPRWLPGTYFADYAGRRVTISSGTKTGNRQFLLGPYAEVTARHLEHEGAELDRLLYVGATRARDHLVVSVMYSKNTNNCLAERLVECGARDFADAIEPPRLKIRADIRSFQDMRVDEPPAIYEGQFETERTDLVTRSRTRIYTSATALGHAQREDETEPWARGRGGTRLGRAVHAAIQSLPLEPDDATIAAFSRAQAVAEAIPHRAAEVERLVRWVVRESAAWGRAKTARRAMREVPFALAENGTVLEGFIDLLLEMPDGALEIVDWKTDQIPAGDVPARLKEYELQAGLYVYGLQEAVKRQVSRVTYVFAGAQTEMSPGDPSSLAAAARDVLMTRATLP